MKLQTGTDRIFPALSKSWDDHPLAIILVLGFLFRMLAAFFARGWGMLDDHFLVIEAAQSWVDGYDYNFWFPWSEHNFGPTGHNLFYPGIHFLLFQAMKWMHIQDPQFRMLIVRCLLGTFSMLTVYYGFRIIQVIENKKSARLAGLLLAIYFFMPWTGVRNLAESSCIPFIMLGFWQLVRSGNLGVTFSRGFLAGLFFGLAADIRFQVLLFPMGVIIIQLLRGKLRETAWITAGLLCSFFLVQAMIDLFIWGYPFAELGGYLKVNITDRNSYFIQPWYNYFLTVGGLLLPPVSLFFFYGFLRIWKKQFLIFFPAMLFFAFHSYFPNKQERFILPFIPFFIMLGTAGYYRFIRGSVFSVKWPNALRACWIFFWIINLILLSGLTFSYSKRAPVEAMYCLSKYPYLKDIIIENEKGEVPLMPLFYTGKWPHYPKLRPQDTTIYQQFKSIAEGPKFYHPQFIVFAGGRDLVHRVALARASFPLIVYEATAEPGFTDKFMHRLNHVNKADRIYIFRNREFYKNKAK